ncbi:hypothetical protein MMC34_003721 [Xylographa carneopallida]|nr:hypothetical protein [Xylographa carneopallida]
MSTGAGTPSEYSSVFTNLQASVTAPQYLGVFTLTSYDTYGCASQCNDAPSCVAFNVYAERDPSLNANAFNCSNPASTTNYQCTLWGATISASQATNTGQYRDSFQVAITASNDPAWGWTFGSVQGHGDTSAYAFSASLALNPNHASGYSYLLLQHTLHTCPGRNYSIAFDVNWQYATPGQCSVEVSVAGAYVIEPSGATFVPPSGGWVGSGDTFTAQGTDDLLQVGFECDNGANNAVQVDNFVVLPYSGNA